MKYMADQKKIHKKYVIKLLWKARDLLSTLLSVVEHPIPEFPLLILFLVIKNLQYVEILMDNILIFSIFLK